LVRTGKIVRVRTGRPNPQLWPEDRRTLHDSWEREVLVLDALILAVPEFIGYLEVGRWSSTKGASLATYFTGTCARNFWIVYERWRTARLRLVKTLGELADTPPVDDLEEMPLRLSQRDALQRVLGEATPEVRAICAGILDGKTYGEIGDQLGLTARGVEGRMYQLRRKAWRLVKLGHIDPGLIPGSRVALARQAAR
jgi:DNA-directed RNA polymerase specialized sigma24 family protein